MLTGLCGCRQPVEQWPALDVLHHDPPGRDEASTKLEPPRVVPSGDRASRVRICATPNAQSHALPKCYVREEACESRWRTTGVQIELHGPEVLNDVRVRERRKYPDLSIERGLLRHGRGCPAPTSPTWCATTVWPMGRSAPPLGKAHVQRDLRAAAAAAAHLRELEGRGACACRNIVRSGGVQCVPPATRPVQPQTVGMHQGQRQHVPADDGRESPRPPPLSTPCSSFIANTALSEPAWVQTLHFSRQYINHSDAKPA